jgi:hypothetical protein
MFKDLKIGIICASFNLSGNIPYPMLLFNMLAIIGVTKSPHHIIILRPSSIALVNVGLNI